MPKTFYPTQREPLRKRAATHSEFGKAEKKLVVCTRCHEARVGKRWYAPGHPKLKIGTSHKEGIHLVLCPACTMIKNKAYEGELLIDRAPVSHEAEIVHFINTFSRRAGERDPQDRVIEIERTRGGYIRTTTTENQLTVKLAKKLKATFGKKADLMITYSKEPFEYVRAHLVFK